MRLLLGLAALAGTAIMTVKAMQARKRNDETGEAPNDVGLKQVNSGMEAPVCLSK